MKWLFRITRKLFPGVKLTITNKSVSANIGIKGANIGIGKRGAHLNVSIPGTGLHSRTKLSGGIARPAKKPAYSYFCPVCDTKVDPKSKFCSQCGGKFAEGQSLIPPVAEALPLVRRVINSQNPCKDCAALATKGWIPANLMPELGTETECGAECSCDLEFEEK